MFFTIFKNLLKNFDITLARVVDIYQNIIQIYNDKRLNFLAKILLM